MGVADRREQEARRRWSAPFLVATALLVTESAALAQPSTATRAPTASTAPSVALSWSEPANEVGCLGAEGLERAVSEYLGRPAFSSSPADLTLRVRVERRPERGFRALLQIVDLTGAVVGERELTSEGPLCASLDEPLKLAVALMVDSELIPPPEPEPETPPEPAEPRDSEEDELEPSPTWMISADASALVESGLLPNASAGLEIGLELRPLDWFSVRGSGVGFLPSTVELGGPARAKLSLIYGNLALCPQGALSARIRLAACGGLAFGTLFARSSQLEAARSTRRRIFAATLALRATLTLSQRWVALAQIEAVSPYRPEQFVYQLNGQRREFFKMSAPSLIAGLGISVIF